jgi:hypothetical protein
MFGSSYARTMGGNALTFSVCAKAYNLLSPPLTDQIRLSASLYLTSNQQSTVPPTAE